MFALAALARLRDVVSSATESSSQTSLILKKLPNVKRTVEVNEDLESESLALDQS